MSLFNSFNSARRLTVSGVLAVFNKTLDDLAEVARQNEADAVRHAEQAVQSQAAHLAAINEAAAARDIASKLNKLIAPVLVSNNVSDLADKIELDPPKEGE